MNGPDRDAPELEATFRRARTRDAAQAPSFERVMAGRPERRRSLPGVVPAGVLVAVVAIVLLVRSGRTPNDAPFTLELGVLRTQTDFLLDQAAPGVAGMVPRLGVDDWFSVDPARPGESAVSEGGRS